VHTIKQGDLFPPIDEIVKDENNVVVDVTGATIKFSMRKARDPTSIKIALIAGSVINGPLGKIRYQPAGSDTDTPGTYEGEFQVTPAAGNAMRVPTDGYITVVVEEKVA
jgi:hypothetical protein